MLRIILSFYFLMKFQIAFIFLGEMAFNFDSNKFPVHESERQFYLLIDVFFNIFLHFVLVFNVLSLSMSFHKFIYGIFCRTMNGIITLISSSACFYQNTGCLLLCILILFHYALLKLSIKSNFFSGRVFRVFYTQNYIMHV